VIGSLTHEGLREEERRGERSAEFVRESGEEVVLGRVGVLGHLVEPDVVDRQRRPPRQFLTRHPFLLLPHPPTANQPTVI